jgi:tight adherence protein B
MAAVIPFAIIFSVLGALALLLTSFWTPLTQRAAGFGNGFRHDLELAGMRIEPQQYGLVTIGIGAAVWTLTIIVVRPNPLVALFLLVVYGALTAYGARRYLSIRRARRTAQFQDQLEMALRTLGSSVRVGLGIRQAFVLTAEQNRDPVRHEFTRVVGLSNVGVNLLDAFDQMALRMTNPETAMLARVLRVQAQTGGDLASVLDSLANTIRDRRRIRRRISAITAQGRATSVLLGLLPLALGGFLIVAEPQLRDAMLFTLIGQILLGAALALDGIAIFTLMKIVNIDP